MHNNYGALVSCIRAQLMVMSRALQKLEVARANMKCKEYYLVFALLLKVG